MSDVVFSMDPLIPLMDSALLKQASSKPALLSSVLKTVAEAVLDHIVSQWPVDTGLSLAGWGVRSRGGSWEVFNHVDYTSFVHRGIAEQLYKDALSRAPGPANNLLRDRILRSQTPAGVRQIRNVSAESLGRLGAGTVASTPTFDRTIIRAALRMVASLRIEAALRTRLEQLVQSGRMEEAMRELVRNGLRVESRRLARLIATD